MTDTTSKFLKRLKGLTLSANERLQMRERLAMYADMHEAAEAAGVPVFGSFFSFVGSRRFSTYAVAIVLLAAVGGGVTLAAEGSVPGDSLYAVKINVNEPLMTALATTPAGQAKVAASIATRRIDEAVTLASRHELTAEKQQYLSTQFDERVKAAAKKTDELALVDSTAAADVKENFAANLAGEAQALGAVSAGEKDGAKELLSVVVMTSESISDSANPVEIAVTSSESSSSDESSSTVTVVAKGASVHVVHTSTLMASSSSTTSSSTASALRAFVIGRFSKHLRIASTTLHGIASSTFSGGTFLMPHLDVAIPAKPAMPSFMEGEDGDVHFGE